MNSTFEITTSALAFWRHELYAPINIIQGYSSLIMEELEDQNASQENSNNIYVLSKILKTSKEIQEIISQTLDSKLLENEEAVNNITNLRCQLEKELTPQIDCISLEAQKILEAHSISIEFEADLEKILSSTYTLKNLLGKDLDWLKNFSSSSNPLSEKKSSVGEKGISHHPKSTLLDVERSLQTIKHSQISKCLSPDEFSILVVENNKGNQELLYRQLERQGYQVNTVESGEEALEIIQKENYDLILLDILMPGLNGYQVLRQLKNSRWQGIPIIMISSLNEIESITKCIEMGAEDYLPKPFNFTLLRAKIDACLEKKKFRDQEKKFIAQLAAANEKIEALNKQLEAENNRLSTELEITRRLQQLILPRDSELGKIEDLDISGFMEPAEEVGGDYYDVHQCNGNVHISIGDITGHGLESGVLMLMVQTALRTLVENDETDQKKILNTLNQVILNNADRLESNRNLTLSLINYDKGDLSISGQHEDILIIRSNGTLERIDTTYLGFPIGLEKDINEFISQTQLSLSKGDVMALYTDGITEAEDNYGNQYGIERLCQTVHKNHNFSAYEIKLRVIEDFKKHIGENQISDDITLLVMKQK